MALFGGHTLDRLDETIASFGNGEAAKVDRCVRIGNLAIVTGWTTAEPDIAIRGTFFSQRYRRDDVERQISPTGKGFIKACHLPGPISHLDLLIRVGRKRYRSQIEISNDPATIETLGLEQQALLPDLRVAALQILPENATALAQAFATALTSSTASDGDAVAKGAAGSEDGQHGQRAELQPAANRHIALAPAAAIDEIIQVGERGFLIVGWCISAEAAPAQLQLAFGPERAVNLLDDAYRVARPDLIDALGPAIRSQAATAGFLSYVQDNADQGPVSLSAGFELDGKGIAMPPLPPVKRFDDPVDTAHELLKHFHPGGQAMLRLLDEQLGPAVADLPFSRARDTGSEIIRFGEPPVEPRVSVIVPIYGRYDFVEFQLSQFANDPDFRDWVDLIYVLDDPSLTEGFTECCAAVSPIYEVPFSAVIYRAHLGFAGANNLAIQHARAEQLLLLNSDIIPSQAGWVTAMLERFEAQQDCVALGARLLYPDDALQHDGMVFKRLPSLGGLWINDHPGKGLPVMPVEPHRAVVPVQAATAACLMLRKADLLGVGGLDEGYIIGDFEDSDLCLALRQQGKQILVARDVQLYHLERQSQSLFADQSRRDKITVYNCWRHTRKWGAAIARLSAEEAH
ncbi:glycosyltransferase family 2 protein [Halochromatium sp.]